MNASKESENIRSFLSRLRLPEQYLTSFHSNGYFNVNDCVNLNECGLRKMGVTLPGHLRRILNKLPTSSVMMETGMDFLSPGAEDYETGRNSPGLQHLPLRSEKIAEAHLERGAMSRDNPKEISEREEDPYMIADSATTKTSFPFESKLSQSPSTIVFPETTRWEQESSENQNYPLPPPPLPPENFTDREGVENLSPFPTNFPPIPIQEDPYLACLPSPPIDEEDPYLTETTSTPSQIYNSLRESTEDNEIHDSFSSAEDVNYDHLIGDITTNASATESPNSTNSITSMTFNQNLVYHENRDSNAGEDEYDRLGCGVTQSPAKKTAGFLTPPRSRPHSRSPSTDLSSNQERQLLFRTSSNGSAKNMPLPPLPWRAAVDEKLPTSQGSEVTLSTLLTQSSEAFPVQTIDYRPQEAEEIENNPTGDYDVLSLTRNGHTKYDAKTKMAYSQSLLEKHDEPTFSEYETVEYLKRDETPFGRARFAELPPVPHNTPSRTTDKYTEGCEDETSYEEVEFPSKQLETHSSSLDATSYAGVDVTDQECSMTFSEQQVPSNKKGLGGRRLTGLQAQLQKAKAAVTRRMPLKKSKLEYSRNVSLSDNESEGCLSLSAAISIDGVKKSLEDLTTIPDLPPMHPTHNHDRPLSNDMPAAVRSSSGSADSRTVRMSRKPTQARRKRAGALSSTSHVSDTSSGQQSAEVAIYEDLDLAESSLNSNECQSQTLNTQKLPVKDHLRQQRPVSVFLDPSARQEEMAPSTEDRGRTYSATLKRVIVDPTRNVSAGNEECMDIKEFLGSYQHHQQVIPVSPLTKKRTKSGWLWKHGGQEGRAPLRKRWAVFDGDELCYYESESKTDITKGILPVEVILRLQLPPNSQTMFHLQMKGGRNFIFQAENGDERTMWASTLMAAMLTCQQKGTHQHKPGGNMFMPYKEGSLKMEGTRHRIYMAIKGDQAVYYKSKNEFLFAQPIARLDMKIATVKDLGPRKFQVVFPYRTFTFAVESEEDKKSWIESLQDAISEGLSDYQVLNDIWANASNKKCADCGRALPDWASINLAIVICKHCAGVHREIGVHNSKVRSLKMDIKIWDQKMKRLLMDIGNQEANKFWVCDLSSSDGITDMADKHQRAWFIKSKYIDMAYVKDRREGDNQELLNQSLVQAVRNDDLIQAYHLTFSGADINCFTGKEYAATPYLLAAHLTYTTLAEFLRQNGGTDVTSPKGHITDRNTSVRKKNSIPKTRSKPPVCLRDCLFKYGGDFKGAGEDTKTKGKFNLIISALQPGDFQKRLCVLENSCLKYCDPEKPTIVKDSLSCSDLISITVHTPEQAIKAGYKHCFELSRTSGRTYLFCADREETRIRWTRGMLQEIVPAYIQDAMQTEEEYERIGKVKMKAKLWSKSDTQWSTTWCRLRKKKLQYYHYESRKMETIDLRRLVQISVDQTRETTSSQSNGMQNKDAMLAIMLVFREKSYYIHSETKPDTDSWMAALKRADNESGDTLEEKQLTTEGVPIVLEKCLTYVEQFGIDTRGIYRLSGTHSKTTQLLNDFRQNARETQMREGCMNVHDVANALKRWFKSLPGSLLTESLHDQWIETAQIKPEHHSRKLEWYKHLIEKLPDINRVTLKVLLNHLKNVAGYAKENEMSSHNLAIVFGPTLMEPQTGEESGDKYIGQTSQEIACIDDLLQYYDWLFDVTDVDREKEQRMQLAKEKINQAKQQQSMLTTMDYDMMVPIYINRKEDRCENYKVNLQAGELLTKVCKMHGYPPQKWSLFEVILDGDGERPLHYSEHVLSVIKSWDMPSSNYLVAKNDYVRDKMTWFKAAPHSNVETIMEGQLRFFEGKKKWSKVTGCVCTNLQDGTAYFKYYKNAAESSNLDSRELTGVHRRKRSIKARNKLMGWSKFGNVSDTPSKPALLLSITSFNIYVGVDKKTKPPGNWRQGFTIHQPGESLKYFVAETEGELFRWIAHILRCMHPEGFTPPSSEDASPSKTLDEEEGTYSEVRYNPYGAISQQNLGAQIAARVVNLHRTSSTESTGSAQKNFSEREEQSSVISYSPSHQDSHSLSTLSYGEFVSEVSDLTLEDVYDLTPSRPTQLTTDSYARRPMLHHPLSPADPRNQQRAGLGLQLQDELSNVLRKRTH